jgi:hypothetical protein
MDRCSSSGGYNSGIFQTASWPTSTIRRLAQWSAGGADFRETGPLITTLLPDGRVLVAGENLPQS